VSSAINVYAVAVDQLRRAFGSRDQKLIAAIVTSHKHFLSTIDDIDDEAEMSCAQALAELVNGTQPKDGAGYLYGYALEALCGHLGEELPNICPIAGASAWIEEMDRLLASRRVPLQLMQLVFGGSPVPIPEPDDAPCIGVWRADELPAAAAAFRALDPSGLDHDMTETLAQFRGWVEAALRTPGRSIIGFLS